MLVDLDWYWCWLWWDLFCWLSTCDHCKLMLLQILEGSNDLPIGWVVCWDLTIGTRICWIAHTVDWLAGLDAHWLDPDGRLELITSFALELASIDAWWFRYVSPKPKHVMCCMLTFVSLFEILIRFFFILATNLCLIANEIEIKYQIN